MAMKDRHYFSDGCPTMFPLRQPKTEPADDSVDELDEDMAGPDPASMLSVRLEEREPSALTITLAPSSCKVDEDDAQAMKEQNGAISQATEGVLDLSLQAQKPCLYMCKICNKAFAVETDFEAHMESHKIQKAHLCNQCPKSFNRKSELNVHVRTHYKVKPFACQRCEKTFAQKNNLLRHTRTHTGEKPFHCTFCNRAFAHKDVLVSHVRVHTGERPYSCMLCGQAFGQRHTLTRHLRDHANAQPLKSFSCQRCGKCFPRQVNLDIHMRTHTGERPFGCEQCGRRFSQSGHLARHELTHGGRALPFPCPRCGKAFSQKKRLADHARTHTGERPFACRYCPKRFTHAEYLKSHVHTHREEKYVCPICREMFSRRYKLVEHTRTHTGERPFECDLCKARFIAKKDICDHIHGKHVSEMMEKVKKYDKTSFISSPESRHKQPGSRSISAEKESEVVRSTGTDFPRQDESAISETSHCGNILGDPEQSRFKTTVEKTNQISVSSTDNKTFINPLCNHYTKSPECNEHTIILQKISADKEKDYNSVPDIIAAGEKEPDACTSVSCEGVLVHSSSLNRSARNVTFLNQVEQQPSTSFCSDAKTEFQGDTSVMGTTQNMQSNNNSLDKLSLENKQEVSSGCTVLECNSCSSFTDAGRNDSVISVYHYNQPLKLTTKVIGGQLPATTVA